MSEEKINFSVPSDEDGFITLKCPYCGEEFKVLTSVLDDENILELFCPYCGLINEIKEFWPPEIIEQVKALAYNYLMGKLDKEFKKLERSTSSNKYFKFEKGKEMKKLPQRELIEPNLLQKLNVPCCNTVIKIRITNSVVYCPICGGMIDGNRD